MKKPAFHLIAAAIALSAAAPSGADQKPTLKVDDSLPAGNIIVESIEGDCVRLRQDLRDSTQWFYWAFRVRGGAGRTIKFDFTNKSAGGPVGVRGPVVSTDGGKTFSYPLDGKSTTSAFTYTFGPDDNDVRFYECHPYVKADWDKFILKHQNELGRHLVLETLCRSKKGAAVPRARFGCVAPGSVPAVRFFMSARHHASETMASFVLEGAAEAFFADDDLGAWLRKNAELMMVPFTDYDGVQAGDQGKNRRPHDHNRDYGAFIYNETKAIVDWIGEHAEGKLFAFIDVHCPWIRGNYNEFVYSPLKDPADAPDLEAEKSFSHLLEKVQIGSLRYLAKNDLPFGKEWNKKSNYSQGTSSTLWASKNIKGVKLVRSYEIPFANANGAVVTPDKCREFGRDFMKALKLQYEKSLKR